MNIIDYVKKNGSFTFSELPCNEVDDVIFSSLSYINFDGILDNSRINKVSLEEASLKFFKKYSKEDLDNNIIGVQSAINILKYIFKEKRYKDILLYNYVYKWDDSKQFSALFIDVDKVNTYISYEGTDDLISGWKEDFELSYRFPVDSHIDAIKYINKSIPIFSRRHYYLVGHSKGGNLALVSGMYANPIIKKKIKKIKSFDGPGLLSQQMESIQFKNIQNRYELIIPNYSIIGLLLYRPENYQVILSNKKGILAHNILSWQIMDDKFVSAKLSSFSSSFDRVFSDWLKEYDLEERKNFVDDMFMILKRANIDSLLDIKASMVPSLISIIKESTKINNKSKNMMMKFIEFIRLNITQDITQIIKSKIKNKKI